jgi:2-succinyl-6-hydroxy-2,4-cyclohexadiene-1-carboxylate synthase
MSPPLAVRWSLEHGMVVRRTGGGGSSAAAPVRPRVVWIHGLGESSVSFESSLHLLPGYAHVLVDLPGCGRSPWPEVAPSLDDVAGGLAAWLGSQPPAVLVGHSLGGVLAMLVAERASVAGVVQIDSNLTRGDCSFSARANAYSLEDFTMHGFDVLRDAVYADGATKAALRGYHAALSFASPDVFHRHARELVELSETRRLGPRLAALAAPKLFIAGMAGGICTESQKLLDSLPVPWVGVDHAGHWVYLDQPAAFTEALSGFLQAL